MAAKRQLELGSTRNIISRNIRKLLRLGYTPEDAVKRAMKEAALSRRRPPQERKGSIKKGIPPVLRRQERK